MSYYIPKFLSLVFVLFFATTSIAQPKDNAPFSRLGLGDPVNQNFAAAIGMGSLSATFNDHFHSNILNPAAIGQLAATTFEVGVFGEYSNLELNNQSAGIWSGNLQYLSLGFPLQNPLNELLERKKKELRWGMNIALLPYTTIGYDIQTEETSPGIDTTLNVFRGSGGTNKILWGNGFRYKNFYGGFNLGFLFGKLENERRVFFRSLEQSFDDEFRDDINIKGFLWNLGFQYHLNIDKEETDLQRKKYLVIGAYGNSATDFTTESTKLRIGQNFNYGAPGLDTALNVTNLKEKGKLPAEFTFGLMYHHRNKFRFGLEYGFGKWSDYKNEAKDEQFSNAQRFNAGLEYIPDANSYNNYFKRVRYRAGLYFNEDPRVEDLKNYGLSLGFGLPLVLPRQQTSFVNLAFEIGQFGTPDSIKETYFRCTVGFTLNDNSWFFKRKFN